MQVQSVPIGQLSLSPEEQNWLTELYEESFPIEERRPTAELFGSSPQGLELYLLYTATDDNRQEGETASSKLPIGFVTLWHLVDFVFVEHLCLSSACRSLGYGSEVMMSLICRYAPLPLVLECELPDYSPMAGRRIAFYQRLGFEVLPLEYAQPPYTERGDFVPMCLLSNQPDISPSIIDTLYTRVYGISPTTLQHIE